MSHVVSSRCVALDIECLKHTIMKHFPQLKWVEKKKYNWFGKWMADFHGQDAAYKNGIAPEDYGNCDFCIQMPGVHYEIGVVKRKDGAGWTLVWDFYSDGKKLSQCVGDGAEKVMVAYQQEYITKFANLENMNLEMQVGTDETYFEMEVSNV